MAILTSLTGLGRRYGHVNWAFADQGIVSGSNVLTGLLLARFLGVNGFGTYSLAWAVLVLVASVHLPLIVGSMMSIGPKQSDQEAPGYYGAVIIQNLAVALAGSVIVMIGAEVVGRLMPGWDLRRLAFPLGLATFATVWQEFFRRFFFTRGRPAAAFAVDAARYVSQIAILLFFFAFVPGIVDAGFALWVVAGAAAVPAAVSLKFLGPIDYRAGVMRTVAARHYHTSKWMVMSEPIEWASEYVFMFAAGAFFGTAAVGALRASQNVAAMTNIVFLSLMNVVPTRAAHYLQERGMAAMSGYLRRVTLIAGPATAVVCLVLALAPTFWLRILYGEAFTPYSELVRWWALYYAVNFFALPLRAGLRAMEQTRPVFTSRLWAAFFALISAGLLVPWFGLRGAVIGAVTTKTIATLWLWRLYRKHEKVTPAVSLQVDGRLAQADGIDVPAVILSGNLGKPTGKWSMNEPALALTRSLGRRGVRVFRFHPDRSLADLTSRYCTHVPCPNIYDNRSGLVESLVAFAAKDGTRPVLFPASDGAAQFIADNEQALRDHFILTSPDAVCISKTQHKRELIEIAGSFGIPVPETYFPTDASELAAIAHRVSYPLIVKPVYSPDWKRPEITSVFGRVKALRVSDQEQLVRMGCILLSLNSVFMIQEIVPGPDENLITFLGYVGHDGQVLAGCVRKKLRQFPPDFGYCCLTESVNDQEVFDLSVKLFRSLDYRGIGCVEFKRDPRDGKPKLIEINTRAVRTSMLAIAAGVDFPWIAYQDCVGRGATEATLHGKVPVRWVHLRDEILAASLLILRGEISFIAWVKGFLNKPIVVAEFSWDDLWPGILFWAQAPRRLATLLFKRKTNPLPDPAAMWAQRANK